MVEWSHVVTRIASVLALSAVILGAGSVAKTVKVDQESVGERLRVKGGSALRDGNFGRWVEC